MSLATMTMMGLCDYDESVKDAFTFPQGIDRELAIDTIIMNCGDYELMYPNATFMKHAIKNWCSKYARTFEKWCNALNLEYNPIENYDRNESWTDTTTSTGTTTSSNSTTDLSHISKSSFDSATLQVTDSNDASTSMNNNGSTSGNSTSEHTSRIHGNVGVTTSQQMIESELKLSSWSLYDNIADKFTQEFVIGVL